MLLITFHIYRRIQVLHLAKEDGNQRSMHVLRDWRIFKHPAANKDCNGHHTLQDLLHSETFKTIFT